jgi:hypothetical protein
MRMPAIKAITAGMGTVMDIIVFLLQAERTAWPGFSQTALLEMTAVLLVS